MSAGLGLNCMQLTVGKSEAEGLLKHVRRNMIGKDVLDLLFLFAEESVVDGLHFFFG